MSSLPAPPPTPSRRRPRLLMALAAVALFVIAAGIIGATRSSSNEPGRALRTGTNSSTDHRAGHSSHLGGTSSDAPTDSAPTKGGDESAADGQGSANSTYKANPTNSPIDVSAASKVVKTGSVDLTVAADDVVDVTNKAATIAADNGGFVIDRQSEGNVEHPSGTITIRVPNDHFDAAIGQVAKLGKVTHSHQSGKDVTSDYVDVTARLRALQDTRNQFVTLLTKADNITDILAVQDRMNSLQVEIEQLQGQKKVLDDQTTYATLAISVSDGGAATTPAERTGFDKAVHDAGDAFTSATEKVVAGSGLAAFWLVVLIVAALVGLGVRRLIRRAQSGDSASPDPSVA